MRPILLASAVTLSLLAVPGGCSDDSPPPSGGASLGAGGSGGSSAGTSVCPSACQGVLSSLCPADSSAACEAQCEAFFQNSPGCPEAVTAFWRCVGSQPSSSFQCSKDDHGELIGGACKAESTAIRVATCAGGAGGKATAGAGGAAGSANAGSLGESACYQCAESACVTDAAECIGNAKCRVYLECIEACPAAKEDALAPSSSCLASCTIAKGSDEWLLFTTLGQCLDEQDDVGGACQAKCGGGGASGGSSGAGGNPAAAYPSGPYGAAVGKVIENHSLIGLVDPEAAGYKTLGNTTKIRLGDFYNPSKTPSRPRVLRLVRGSAADALSKAEASTARAEHDYWFPKGVTFLYALTEDDTLKPATFSGLEAWTKKYTLDFPSVIDPSPGVFAAYFSNTGASNLVVDLTTMRIEKVINGGGDWGEDSKVLYDALVKADTP